MTNPILSPRPLIDARGVPWCDDGCPQHDGKRCQMLGQRPDAICEPAVREMAALLLGGAEVAP